MINCAIYIRVSSHQQNTDRQKLELTEYANRNNLNIVKIYEDIISGFTSTEERFELNNLIQDAKLDKFKIILFSEFTRLGRSQNEIYKLIQGFHSLKIELYFLKQNITISEKIDTYTQLSLLFLSISAENEIKLFVERSISGKISNLKQRNIWDGGIPNFGYNVKDKKLVIDEKESALVKNIFEWYDSGISTYEIALKLSIDNIDTIYTKKLGEINSKRQKKGLPTKEYANKDKWNMSSINKILKNRIYIGERSFTFHVPNFSKDDVDELFKKKENNNQPPNEKKEVYESFTLYDEDIKIIENDLFERIQTKIKENRLNKHTEIKYKNLLKSKLKCGECGGNYSIMKQNNYQSYRCYNSYATYFTKTRKCFESSNIKQNTLNGLVVQLSLYKFADIQIIENSNKKMNDLQEKNETLNEVLNNLDKETNTSKTKWINYFNKAIKYEIPDEEIQREKKLFDDNNIRITRQIELTKQEINQNTQSIRQLKNIDKDKSIYNRIKSLKESKEEIKMMVEKYIDKIIITHLYDKYSLVEVSYIDGTEYCGTVKSAKYRTNDEYFYNPLTNGIEKISLFYYNESIINKNIEFNFKKKVFNYCLKNESLLQTTEEGIYSIEEFVEILKINECTISFNDFEYNDIITP